MNIANLLGAGDTWQIVKVMFLVGMVLYLIFAFVIVKQISHMTKTLKVGFESPIRILGLMHFIAAFIIFILAIFYL